MPSSLLVVLRGGTFPKVNTTRTGPSKGEYSDNDTSEQLLALESIVRHVLVPARKAGWHTAVAADMVVAPQHRDALVSRMHGLFGRSVALRLHEALTIATQLIGWLHTLEWVRSDAAFQALAWAALLIVRADLAFKSPLLLPSPEALTGSTTVFAPFKVLERFGAQTSHNHTRMNDVMLLVPSRADHYGELSVDVLSSTSKHDLNSMLEWPYRLIGRREAPHNTRESPPPPQVSSHVMDLRNARRLSISRICTCVLHVRGSCRQQPQLSNRFFELRVSRGRECLERQRAWAVTCGPSGLVKQLPCNRATLPWPQEGTAIMRIVAAPPPPPPPPSWSPPLPPPPLPPVVLDAGARAAAARATSCAILTYVHNEARTLPIWLRYYLRHAPAEDLYVLDHNTDDGSTAQAALRARIHVVRIAGPTAWSPHEFLNRIVEGHMRALLTGGYRCVLLTEVDDIVAPDPDMYPGGLRELLMAYAADAPDGTRFAPYLATHGMQLAHISEGTREVEPPMDWGGNLLAQRRYWGYDRHFSKPYLTRRPLRYEFGFHHAVDIKSGKTPESHSWLVLIHLHHADRAYCEARQAGKAAELKQRGALDDEAWRIGASHTDAAHATVAVQHADKWCAWAHSRVSEQGFPTAPVNVNHLNSRWGITPSLHRIPSRWAAVQI